MRSKHVHVVIDLDRIRASAEDIRVKTRVPLIAVVKADAYGLGALRVAAALDGVADDFAYFSLDDAREVGRPGLVLGPPEGQPAEYRELRLRPTVMNRQQAAAFSGLPVAISVDTCMQWPGCRAEELEELLKCSTATDVYTHGNDISSARALRALGLNRSFRLHAAATFLLEYSEAWLDAVRPGLALYRGAVRVTTRLVAVRETRGPVGYTGFDCPRVGVILAGYGNHLQPGPILINGRVQRVLEACMNTSFVSVHPRDRVGDEVVLMGDELTETRLARELNVRPQEIVSRYALLGVRQYVSGASSVSSDSAYTTRSTAPVPRQT